MAIDWEEKQKEAARTARWATTMTRWAIRFATNARDPKKKAVKRWQFVGFPGANGGESVGIVDLLAIRRDHSPPPGFMRGDVFEMILVQIKGGTAGLPSARDLRRLWTVQQYYRAKSVVLAEWKKGQQPRFFALTDVNKVGRAAWQEMAASEIFGSPCATVTARNVYGCKYCGKDHRDVKPCPEFKKARRRFTWEEGDVTFSHEPPLALQHAEREPSTKER